MTVHPDAARLATPCDRPDCRHARNLLAQSVPMTDLDAARARIVELAGAATAAYKALKVESMTDGLSDDLDEAMDHLHEVLAPISREPVAPPVHSEASPTAVAGRDEGPVRLGDHEQWRDR